jgi:hypothetical protein
MVLSGEKATTTTTTHQGKDLECHWFQSLEARHLRDAKLIATALRVTDSRLSALEMSTREEIVEPFTINTSS